MKLRDFRYPVDLDTFNDIYLVRLHRLHDQLINFWMDVSPPPCHGNDTWHTVSSSDIIMLGKRHDFILEEITHLYLKKPHHISKCALYLSLQIRYSIQLFTQYDIPLTTENPLNVPTEPAWERPAGDPRRQASCISFACRFRLSKK